MPGRTPIRVMLVDDSPLVLTILKRILATSPDIEVVATAKDGKEALSLLPQVQPSVICADYLMPRMDGLEFTRAVMAQYPCPILVVSSVVGPEHPERVFSLLQAGAIDVFPKPRGALDADPSFAEQLINKIRLVSGVFVFGRRPKPENGEGPRVALRPLPRSTTPPRVLAIGASTGGPQALQAVLGPLPAQFPLLVVCVQHISPGFLKGLVDWLAASCRLKVKVAQSGELAQPGYVYFPPEDTHLLIDRRGQLTASKSPPKDGHRPSVSVTFHAVAAEYGAAAIAVILTGMGKDGSDGMLAISRAGGVTIAQDEGTSVVFGMPKEAIELGAAQYVLPLREIAPKVIQLTNRSRVLRET